MSNYDDYLYDKSYERIKRRIESKKIRINEIISVDDLFNSKTKVTIDVIKELEKLKEIGVMNLLFHPYQDKDCYVNIKRIYGLAQEDDYYYSAYEINYHNPRYELEAFYVNLMETLNKQYMWEKEFDDFDKNITSLSEQNAGND